MDSVQGSDLPAAAGGAVDGVADTVEIGGGHDAEGSGAFDPGVFALLLAVLLFVAVTNLWLRWRAGGEGFGEALRRRLGGGRRPPGST